MSRSDRNGHALNSFDAWIAHEFRRTGGFTALVVLVATGGLKVTPLRSTFVHVVGDEIGWAGMASLFAGSGVAWDAALFATRTGEDGGPIPDALARSELRELAERLREDRLVVNENHFFDLWGRRMLIEEVTPQ